MAKMKLLWNYTVLYTLSLVYASSIKTKLTELLETNLEKSGGDIKNVTRCHLRQTMAWDECGRYTNCPTSCRGPEDCAFPYCDSQGICSCRNAFCQDDHMCNFFRIACTTKFACKQGGCYCDIGTS